MSGLNLRTPSHVDIPAVAEAALRSLPDLLSRWLPDGRREGREWVAKNPCRADRTIGSFKVNMSTGKWSDFATGNEGGDPVSLHAFLHGTTQVDAARAVAGQLGMPQDARRMRDRSEVGRTPPLLRPRPKLSDVPVPAWTEPGEDGKPKFISLGKPEPRVFGDDARRHRYVRDGQVVRVKVKKVDGGWCDWYHVRRPSDGAIGWQAFKPEGYVPVPYLTPGARNPFDPDRRGETLVWAEGEKDADAAHAHGFHSFTFGSASTVPDVADMLHDHAVIVAVDNDEAGRKSIVKKVDAAIKAGARSVRVVQFVGQADGFDAADFFAAGSTAEDFLDRAERIDPGTWRAEQNSTVGAGQKEARRSSELQRIAETYPVPELAGRKFCYDCLENGRVWLHETIKVGKGESMEIINVPIASPFGVTDRLRVIGDADAYGLRLLLEDMGGQPRRVDIERRALATMNGVEVRGLFLEAGVRFEDHGEKIAVAALKAAHPQAEIDIVRHPGWHDVAGARVYVAPGGEVIGLPEGSTLELTAGAALSASVAKGGSLEGWKTAAASAMAADGCPHFALGLAAGFAGVLVDLCGLDSCGINLSGMTSAGKTTAQRLAASACSVPDSTKGGLFQVAKTTANGFEALAERANGTVAALDELAHLTGKETARCIYTLASGVGKLRLTAAATVRESRHWRTFALLSSETGLEAKIRSDGEAWTGGQAVRISDIDVTNVFRHLDRPTFDTISSVARHYGHAGPAFVRALVARGTHERAGDVRNAINETARRLAGKGADAATVRAALPLAILYVAGDMAQEYDLLPKGDAIKDAVTWAWRGFRGSSDAAALDPTEQAIRSIRQWIAERWRTSLHGIHAEERPTRDAVGWWDGDCVYLTPDRLVEAAGGALKETQIAKALNENGMLAKTKGERHLYCSWVPTVGKLKAYALSREHFGRGRDAEPHEDGGLRISQDGRG